MATKLAERNGKSLFHDIIGTNRLTMAIFDPCHACFYCVQGYISKDIIVMHRRNELEVVFFPVGRSLLLPTTLLIAET